MQKSRSPYLKYVNFKLLVEEAWLELNFDFFLTEPFSEQDPDILPFMVQVCGTRVPTVGLMYGAFRDAIELFAKADSNVSSQLIHDVQEEGVDTSTPLFELLMIKAGRNPFAVTDKEQRKAIYRSFVCYCEEQGHFD